MNNLRSQPPTDCVFIFFIPSNPSFLFYEWIFVMVNNHGLGNAIQKMKIFFNNLFSQISSLSRVYIINICGRASEIADYHDSSIKIEDAQPHIEQELSERKKKFSWLRMKNSRCILVFLPPHLPFPSDLALSVPYVCSSCYYLVRSNIFSKANL